MSTEEFDFDETKLDVSHEELNEMDQEFLKATSEKAKSCSEDETNDAFTLWFLIVLLLLFVFFIILGIVFVVKGRQRRYEYRLVGYR